MKSFIKSKLRENMVKNALGVSVTKPNQELIVMRGIPGAGKSTKAKSLVDKGVIHSTDDIIDASEDYREFFAKMIATGDFTPLSQMHSKNLKNAIESMKAGVSPVIIDNTNIKQNESKAYVKAALELGYADENIKFVDIGTAGLEAQALAKRNQHGVPLEKIEAMIASHTSQGPLTLKSVLNAKDMYKTTDILYSAVILDAASKTKLLDLLHDFIPQDWKIFAHHMTIAFGKGVKDISELGKEVTLVVTAIGKSDKALAVKVEGYPTTNDIPHITVAIAPDATPNMSKEITKWSPIKGFHLMGKVTDVKKGMKV